jgi:FSR family fosmidomycin resistance protein-like MFS transporter
MNDRSAESRMAASLGAKALRSERLWLLGILTAGHFVIHWFQQFFPVVLPSLKTGLSLDNVQVGALTSARQLAQALFETPLGMVGDAMVRFRPLLLAAALIAMGVGYFLFGAAPLFFTALLGSALIGLGTALWHPTAAAVLSNRFPERRATALSIHGTGATLSDTLTPLAVGWLLALFSWEAVCRAQILVGLAWGLVFWRALAGSLSAAEPAARGSRLRQVGALLANVAFIGVAVATGLMQMGRLIVLTFLPIYLQEELGYSAVALGLFVALLHAMGIVSQPILGVLSDRLGRRAVLVPSFSMLGILFALLAVAEPGLQLGVVIALIGIFFYTLLNITNAAAMDVAGAAIQGSSYGLTFLVAQAVVVPTPMVAGYLTGAFGLRSAFLLAGSCVLVGALIIAPLRLRGGLSR